MSRLLETQVSGSQYLSTSQTKFVDGTAKSLGISWNEALPLGVLATTAARKNFLKDLPRQIEKSADEIALTAGIDPDEVRKEARIRKIAEGLTPDQFKGADWRESREYADNLARARCWVEHNPEQRSGSDRWIPTTAEPLEIDVDPKLVGELTKFFTIGSDEHRFQQARDIAPEWMALDAEEDEWQPEAHERAYELLPTAFRPFVDRFSQARRRERLQAIIEMVGWRALRLIDLDPPLLIAEAEKAAWVYAKKHPADDERFQKPEHRKSRNPKNWKKRLAKEAREARAYIASAVGAVGGADKDSRPLYVADIGVSYRRAELRHSRKTLEKLRIVNANDHLTQIPMLEAHERKKIKEMAKRRLLLDIMEFRADMVGARACWITITLPGEYHPNPTNSTPDANNWNWRLGPKQAMEAIQDRYHQTICMLRERGIRAWGFWDVQAQQDGTPHRHIVIFIHDEDEAKALEEARAVALAFRERFPGVHGCDASVIGDDHPDYKPRNDKYGKEETVASIIRYTARYATRMATGGDGATELAGDVPDDGTPATELERHAIWASERHARLHTVIGLDSQRSPAKIWDSIWKAAERGEAPEDERMGAAVELTRWTQGFLNELVTKQSELAEHEKSKREDLEYEENARVELQRLQHAVTENAYHAALMSGLWPDADLHHTEQAWMREYLDVAANEEIPLAPVPLRAERENAFGETVKETIGIAAPIEIEEPTDDSLLLRMHDGTTRLVRPSDDPTRQIILKTEDWVIVDLAKAKEMSEEALQIRAEKKAKWENGQAEERALRMGFQESELAQSPVNELEEGKNPFNFIEENKGLSDIAIYPSYRPNGLPLVREGPPS